MAENKEGQEKTEDATAKRLNEARMRGQVSKSMDVTTSAVLLFGWIVVFLIGGSLIGNYKNMMGFILGHSSSISITFDSVTQYYAQILAFLAKFLLPIMLIVFLIVLSAEISQVGLKIATKKFTEGLNIKKIFNPFSGLKKIFFSGKSLFELAKSVAKILVLGGVVWWVLADENEKIIMMMELPFSDIGAYMVSISFELILKVGIIYILIAIADFFYQRHRFKEDMKMTKKEIKDESKQAEGDPKIKSRLRQIMRDRIRKLMLKNAEEADVVITNPTHFAVALAYKPGKMAAPKLVGKGADFLAMKIRSIAEENDIPIIEDPPLARTIFFGVDVDQEIPEDLFKAVAQILAHVYKIKGKSVRV